MVDPVDDSGSRMRADRAPTAGYMRPREQMCTSAGATRTNDVAFIQRVAATSLRDPGSDGRTVRWLQDAAWYGLRTVAPWRKQVNVLDIVPFGR